MMADLFGPGGKVGIIDYKPSELLHRAEVFSGPVKFGIQNAIEFSLHGTMADYNAGGGGRTAKNRVRPLTGKKMLKQDFQANADKEETASQFEPVFEESADSAADFPAGKRD